MTLTSVLQVLLLNKTTQTMLRAYQSDLAEHGLLPLTGPTLRLSPLLSACVETRPNGGDREGEEGLKLDSPLVVLVCVVSISKTKIIAGAPFAAAQLA